MKRTSKSASAQVPSKPTRKLASVTPIRSSQPPLSQATRACIEELKYLLEMARRGEIDVFAYVAIGSNTGKNNCLLHRNTAGNTEEYGGNVLGALALLQKDVLSMVEES